MQETLSHQIEALPEQPGVYLFKDEAGKYLYIGKASNLRSRVRSYFRSATSDNRFFVPFLQHEVTEVQSIVVGNEKEAALLESTLIKQHKPRYNIKLRDDKEYLSLRLNPHSDWPRLEAVRRPKDDAAWYFGPYPSATTARRMLRLVNRYFKLRTCTDREFMSRKRPCLQYQIKRCPAPCVLEVNPQDYEKQVRGVMLFLNGKHESLQHFLEGQMNESSQSQAYELAAIYRDQLQALQSATEKQTVTTHKNIDQNVVNFFRNERLACFVVLIIREGKLSDVQHFTLNDVIIPDEELVSDFVSEYFAGAGYIPDEIVLPMGFEMLHGFRDLLCSQSGRTIEVVVAKRGPRTRLLELAKDNAEKSLKDHLRKKHDREAMLAKLASLLQLPAPPKHIECIDISHTAGADTVASIVAMHNGELAPTSYRSFTIKSVSDGDDYGAMYEALGRRFRRGRDHEGGWELPDLLVVDGGKGQLRIAQKVLADLGIEDVPLAALAKGRETIRGAEVGERLFTPSRKNPILVSNHRESVFLTLLRDEAHRSANRMRLKKGHRRIFVQRLDQIPGVGKKTRVLLLKNLGSLEGVKKASVAKLLEAGANRRQAKNIYEAFHADHVAHHAQGAESLVVDNAFESESTS